MLLKRIAIFSTIVSAVLATVNIGMESNGKDVSLKVGEQLRISLVSNPSTGYTWQLRQLNQNIVKQDGAPGYVPDNTDNVPGRRGTSIWHFTGVANGTTTLNLDYARFQDQGSAPAKQFSVNCLVR